MSAETREQRGQRLAQTTREACGHFVKGFRVLEDVVDLASKLTPMSPADVELLLELSEGTAQSLALIKETISDMQRLVNAAAARTDTLRRRLLRAQGN